MAKRIWQDALRRARGQGPLWWGSLDTDPYHSVACAACGRRMDHLFDFVKMIVQFTPVEPDGDGWKWQCEALDLEGKADHESDVAHSFCFDHGGDYGVAVKDLLTAVEWWMPPTGHKALLATRDACQWTVLKLVIGIRFPWYLVKVLAGEALYRLAAL